MCGCNKHKNINPIQKIRRVLTTTKDLWNSSKSNAKGITVTKIIKK